jgi:predicted MPP superfamily phosphohydrolase
MRDLLFVPETLDNIIKELGVSNYSGFLEATNRKVKKITSHSIFHMDAFMQPYAPQKIQDLAKKLESTANASGNYFLHFKKDAQSSVKVFEQIFPAVAIVFFDDTLNNDDALKNKLKQLTAQYKVVLFLNFFADENAAKEISRELGYAVKTFIINGNDCEGKTPEEVLKTVVLENEKLEKLKKLSYINSIKPLFSFLGDVFASENKIVQTRKLLNSQNMQITKKEEQGANTSEVVSNIRQLMQKTTADIDKNFKLKYEDLNKPNIGKFSVVSQEQSHQLHEFDKAVLAEKSERVSVTINKDFQDKFVKSISKNITGELGKDENFIKSSLDEMLVKINQQLQTKGIEAIKKEDVYIPFPEQKKVIESYCYMSKQYSGELVKKGATEYFIALRDYIGVMMVATGLLAPLNLIASLSDEHSSFGWLKQFSSGIKIATALLTLSLIIYGIYDLRKRIPQKREEEFEREIGKARELLFGESKRMFNESSRDWLTSISNWVKEISQNITFQLEKNIKNLQTAKVSQMNNEKQQQQRQQQSIDLFQRNIQSAERMKEMLQNRFRDFTNETEKDLRF